MRLSHCKGHTADHEPIDPRVAISDPECFILAPAAVPDTTHKFRPKIHSRPGADTVVVEWTTMWGSLLLLAGVILVFLLLAFFYTAWESASYIRAARRVLLTPMGLTAIASSLGLAFLAYWVKMWFRETLIFEAGSLTVRERNLLGKLRLERVTLPGAVLRMHEFRERQGKSVGLALPTLSGTLLAAQVGDDVFVLASAHHGSAYTIA